MRQASVYPLELPFGRLAPQQQCASRTLRNLAYILACHPSWVHTGRPRCPPRAPGRTAPAPPRHPWQPARPAAGLPAQPDLGAARDLEALREAFTPGAPHFRFQHLLLNVVAAPAARAKPPGVDELRWREALQVPPKNLSEK